MIFQEVTILAHFVRTEFTLLDVELRKVDDMNNWISVFFIFSNLKDLILYSGMKFLMGYWESTGEI